MKIDADKLKKWIEKESRIYANSLTDYDLGKVQAFNLIIEKINRMVKTEQKKQEGK